MSKPKLPTIKDLAQLVRAIKPAILDDFRDASGELPYVTLTVGCDTRTGKWSYQTGDNSYVGGAYHYPDWAMVSVYRRSDSYALARDIRDQLADLHYQQEG